MNPEATNSPTWKVCKTFNSALLEDEKEGERLNEILCANADEAECLVALLNNLDQEITKKTNEVARLREELDRLKRGCQGSCYACEPVGEMNLKLEAEVARLRERIAELESGWDEEAYQRRHQNLE